MHRSTQSGILSQPTLPLTVCRLQNWLVKAANLSLCSDQILTQHVTQRLDKACSGGVAFCLICLAALLLLLKLTEDELYNYQFLLSLLLISF